MDVVPPLPARALENNVVRMLHENAAYNTHTVLTVLQAALGAVGRRGGNPFAESKISLTKFEGSCGELRYRQDGSDKPFKVMAGWNDGWPRRYESCSRVAAMAYAEGMMLDLSRVSD